MLVIFSVHHKSFAGKSVPEYIRKLVFEESDFSQPVTLRLPCEEEDYIMSGLSGSQAIYRKGIFTLS